MHRWARSAGLILVAAAFLLPAGRAQAEDDEDAKEEQAYRELTEFGSTIELGFLWNSNSSDAFGNYTGLRRQGFEVLSNVDTQWRGLIGGDDASYLRLRGLNLGLDSRYADMEFGQQGLYGLFLEYDQLPVDESETAATFFLNPGAQFQALPPGWDPGPNPAGMTELAASLRQVDVDWERKRIGGGFSTVLPENLTFDARYDYEKKEGNKLMGATMGLNGGNPRAQINWEPLDYATHNWEAFLRYAAEDLQLSLGYYGSAFDDQKNFQRWQTPYSAQADWDPTAGYLGFDDAGVQDATCIAAPETCGLGQKGLMPDNWFHQLLASGGYNLPYRTRVTLSTAFGWMLQDQDFLPYTVNPNLTAVNRAGVQTTGTDRGALPRSSLDGEIFTTVVDFRITSQPLDKWKFDAGYRFDNRDNNTPQDLYVYILNDSEDQVGSNPVDPAVALASGEARINLPYSYRQHRVDFDAGYQIWRRTDLTLGYEWTRTERDFQEVEELDENTLGVLLTSHPYSFLTTRFSYAHSWRDGDGYVGNGPFIEGHTAEFIAAEFTACNVGVWPASQCPFENHPLVRKSYLANRDRDKLNLILTLLPVETLNFTFNFNYINDDYDDSDLGVTQTEYWSPGIDISYTPIDRLTTYAFYNYAYSKNQQNGLAWVGFGQGGVPPIDQTLDPGRRWNSEDKDTTNTAGVGFNFRVLPGRIDFGTDYLYARSKGETDIGLGPTLRAFAPVAFPYADNIAEQHNVSVRVDYHFTDSLTMRLGYLFANFKQSDWALDGVTAVGITPSANGAVIGTGRRSEGYDNHVVAWSMTYTFW